MCDQNRNACGNRLRQEWMGMKRTEKSQDLVKTIIETSRDLFLTLGYRKTTVRQIIDRVGINTGSLYHHFRDKEDIFLHITRTTYNDFIAFADSLAEGENSAVKYALTRALELRLIENHDRIAELYLEAYSSPRITAMIHPVNMARNKAFFHTINPGFTDDDYANRTMAKRGMRLIFIAERVHEGPGRFDIRCPFILETSLTLFNVPMATIRDAVDKALEISKKQIGDMKRMTEAGTAT